MKPQNKIGLQDTVSSKIVARNLFYFDLNRRFKYCLVVSCLSMLLSVLLGVTINSIKSQNRYITLNNDNEIVFFKHLKDVTLPEAEMLDFTSNALIETFTFGFADFEWRLRSATERYFTDDGANSLLAALQKSQNLQMVRDKFLFQTIELKHTPVIEQEGELPSGKKYWRLITEADIKFNSAGTVLSTIRVAIITDIIRIPQTINFEGIGINKVLLQKITKTN